MNQTVVSINDIGATTTVAPIQNVALCNLLLQQAINRPPHLPGMVCFHGPSGWGKSTAAAYAANKHSAYYIECKSTWTKKAVLIAILKEMGIQPATTIPEMADQVAEQLAKSGRPLIVDELDHLVDKKVVEIIRDIYEGSNAPILLIGEENIDIKLLKWERFHNRILAWQGAQPSTPADTKQLAALYIKDVDIADDLLEHICNESRGVTRRICVNLNLVRQEALNMGMDAISRKEWTGELYTGNPAKRKV